MLRDTYGGTAINQDGTHSDESPSPPSPFDFPSFRNDRNEKKAGGVPWTEVITCCARTRKKLSGEALGRIDPDPSQETLHGLLGDRVAFAYSLITPEHIDSPATSLVPFVQKRKAAALAVKPLQPHRKTSHIASRLPRDCIRGPRTTDADR